MSSYQKKTVKNKHHGREIYGVSYMPNRKEKCPIVIFSYGFNGINEDFAINSKYLADRGVGAYCFDFCGGSVNTKSDLKTNEMTIFTFLYEPSRIKCLVPVSSISNKIANGEYKEKLENSGGEEIAEVVQSFNMMADKIQSQMEALENHAREKQRVIDGLAHELRTPLTAIYGYAEYMQKTHLSEEDMSERLLELVIIREEKEIEFVYYNDLKEITGNEDLIESMILNLVDNAIKACSTKGKITMRAYSDQEKKIIEVEDNGKGMTENQLLQVTEAFYRVDRARSRKEGGNGLGLALCEQIAKKHHAELSFSSKPNEKTIVKVIF